MNKKKLYKYISLFLLAILKRKSKLRRALGGYIESVLALFEANEEDFELN